MTGPSGVDDLTCPATSGNGAMRCVKPKYRARNGEAWEHGGGHFFATEEGARRLATGDYDARVLLSQLRPAVTDDASEWPCQGRSSGNCRHDTCHPNNRGK